MTHDEVKHATRLIESAICQHMPTAAIASGWLSPVDPSAWVASMCERFPESDRPESLGLTALCDWLTGQGVTAGREFVKALRVQWLKERMRAEFAAHPEKCVIFTDQRKP